MSTFLGNTWRAHVAHRLEVIVGPPFLNLHPIQQQPRVDRQSSCGAAHRRDAQLISWQVRVGTKEQLSGCWASASSPSDFSCKTKEGENRYREECRAENTSVVLEVLLSRRGEDRQAFCAPFTRSCAAEALRSRTQHSALPQVCIDGRHFFFLITVHNCAENWKTCLCSVFQTRRGALRAHAAFKFGLKGAPLEVYVPRARKGRYDVHIL